MAKTRRTKRKTFLVSWMERHRAEIEATSEREVRDHFWELVGEQLAEEHPHLTFEDSVTTKVEELG